MQHIDAARADAFALAAGLLSRATAVVEAHPTATEAEEDAFAALVRVQGQCAEALLVAPALCWGDVRAKLALLREEARLNLDHELSDRLAVLIADVERLSGEAC
jgi:hypothetical protein